MSKKIFIFMLVLVISTGAFAIPPIYPVTLQMKIVNGESQSQFKIFNPEKKVKKYKITIKERDNLNQPSTLANYLKVFPRYIEIQPGDNQVVRVLLKDFPLQGIADGEYRGAISIEELNSSIQKKYESKNQENGISTLINFNYIINMAVYGYVGKLIPSISLTPTSEDKVSTTYMIQNQGNYSFPLEYELLNSFDKVLKTESIPKLMWNQSIKFKVPKIKGASKIIIIETEKKKKIYTKEI